MPQSVDLNSRIDGEGEPLSIDPAFSETHPLLIREEMSDHRLDYVVSRELGISRNFAQKLIRQGNVEFSPPRRVKPSLKVLAGDQLQIVVPPPEKLELEPEDIPFGVVYDDEDIIVVDKPAGLVVHPAPGHWRGTLVHGLLFRFPDIGSLNGVQRPGIVHRLDATTSGLMVIARNGLAQEGLFRDFKARRVDKTYLALCWGKPKNQEGMVDLPVGRDYDNRLRMAITEDGRESKTGYRVLWSRDGKSLVECKLYTGRTHQIRVHLRAIGCPLVGDVLYAPSRKSPFDPPRVFLHAWKLSFNHPRDGRELAFRSFIPQELRDALV